MKNTVKIAALGAIALAATSTAALAGSELPAGITTGLALGAPLPEGVYDISIASYGSYGRNVVQGFGNTGLTNVAYAAPIWLIWSTPWQIAGGRIQLDSTTVVADAWHNQTSLLGVNVGTDSFGPTLLEGGIKWKLGNGWNAGFQIGALVGNHQIITSALQRDYVALQALGSVSYVANGWNLTATGIWGSGGKHDNAFNNAAPWFNLDLTATRKFGKFETGLIAYGSWDQGCMADNCTLFGASKQSQFAVGSLVGYDFGSFITQAKVAYDIAQTNYGDKEIRGTLTIIKPLWNPEEGSLK